MMPHSIKVARLQISSKVMKGSDNAGGGLLEYDWRNLASLSSLCPW